MVAAGLAFALPSSLAAQVLGHLPNASPYLDVDSPQELAIFAGYYVAAKDLAGVAPRGTVIGARETLHLGGPAIARVSPHARLLRPHGGRPSTRRSQRDLGSISDPLTILDAGLGFDFTGDRSFHQSAVRDQCGGRRRVRPRCAKDVGGYRFGTSLAVLTYGAGIRWVPPGRLSLRINADNYMYEHSYPKLYHTITGDGTSVVPTTHSLVDWRNNGMYTFGVSYAIHSH